MEDLQLNELLIAHNVFVRQPRPEAEQVSPFVPTAAFAELTPLREIFDFDIMPTYMNFAFASIVSRILRHGFA
jgi:hypothetical protein